MNVVGMYRKSFPLISETFILEHVDNLTRCKLFLSPVEESKTSPLITSRSAITTFLILSRQFIH